MPHAHLGLISYSVLWLLPEKALVSDKQSQRLQAYLDQSLLFPCCHAGQALLVLTFSLPAVVCLPWAFRKVRLARHRTPHPLQSIVPLHRSGRRPGLLSCVLDRQTWR